MSRRSYRVDVNVAMAWWEVRDMGFYLSKIHLIFASAGAKIWEIHWGWTSPRRHFRTAQFHLPPVVWDGWFAAEQPLRRCRRKCLWPSWPISSADGTLFFAAWLFAAFYGQRPSQEKRRKVWLERCLFIAVGCLVWMVFSDIPGPQSIMAPKNLGVAPALPVIGLPFLSAS